jgi:arginyl-tRNA synthetase
LITDRSIQTRLDKVFSEALTTMGAPAGSQVAQVQPADPKFGDYQCTNAMKIFQLEKGSEEPRWKSPRAVGEALSAAIPGSGGNASPDLFEKVTVAGPGFVTVRLSQTFLEEGVRILYRDGPRVRAAAKQRIVVDFSSPNVAKEMHVGHLRSTILGDVVSNLMEWVGHEVVRLNHVGDWGTQFGMLLEHMRREGSLDSGEATAIGDLQTFYRAAKRTFDEDASFKVAAQKNVVALQGGEDWAREAWSRICEASRREFDELYRRLDIRNLDERGESFYNDMLPGVVDDLEKIGLVQDSDGAKCIFTKASKAPLIVRKADGGYGYDSTDVAAVRHRLREENADRIVYVIDSGQESHMRMVFEVAERAGWLSDSTRLDFMGFGVIQGEDGKKFKTRSGDVVRLRDLLDEAALRAGEELKKRRNAESEEISADAELVGVAAVKYFDLRQHRNTDYRFSYDAMLDPKGNTAVYVLYAYARIAGILRKAGDKAAELDETAVSLSEPAERALALRLLQLPEVASQTLDDLEPNRLIDYVYRLSVDFSAFYTACPVLDVAEEKSRLVLCEVTRKTLAACFAILGIKPLERL